MTLATSAPSESDYQRLESHPLVIPVEGVRADQIRDTFNDARAQGRIHDATDIAAPRDTPVLAVDDGVIRKLFTSVRGGLTIYEFDPTGTYCYYYAHLDHYAPGLAENRMVRHGEVIGYVGTTGDAPPNAPHLHLEIMKLGADKRWWQGTSIDPYPLLKRIRP